VKKRCEVLIPESQKLKQKDFLSRNKLRGLSIGGLNCILRNIKILGWRLPLRLAQIRPSLFSFG
jgi:hypothetical protein